MGLPGWILAVALTLLIAGAAQAAPRQLGYERCLTDGTGAPIADGIYNLRFKLYSGPTRMGPLWESDGLVQVEVKDGCFHHVLGSSRPFPKTLNDYTTVWVGVAIGNGAEIRPRTQVNLKSVSNSPAAAALASAPTAGVASTGHAYSDGGFPDIYVHGGLAFGLGAMSTDETYEAIIWPFQPGMGVGYQLGLGVGIRNIYQFQYRPRLVTSSDLNEFQGDTVIPMDLHVKGELVHKFNLLFFKKPNRGMAPCLFVTYGTASTGNVRHVDEVGSGFLNGSTKMLGLEAGILRRNANVMFFVERRAATFSSFEIINFASYDYEIEATFWSVGFQIAVGTGWKF